MVDKDSSQSDGTPAKQKCTLNQGSLSYLAFISAGTKFTDGERVSDSTDLGYMGQNFVLLVLMGTWSHSTHSGGVT